MTRSHYDINLDLLFLQIFICICQCRNMWTPTKNKVLPFNLSILRVLILDSIINSKNQSHQWMQWKIKHFYSSTWLNDPIKLLIQTNKAMCANLFPWIVTYYANLSLLYRNFIARCILDIVFRILIWLLKYWLFLLPVF